MKVVDTMRRDINIKMDNEEQDAINTVNQLIAYIIRNVGLGTEMVSKKGTITINTHQLAQACAVLQAIAENSEWNGI